MPGSQTSIDKRPEEDYDSGGVSQAIATVRARAYLDGVAAFERREPLGKPGAGWWPLRANGYYAAAERGWKEAQAHYERLVTRTLP